MATDNSVIPMKEWMQRSTLDFFKRHQTALMIPQVVHISQDPIVKVMSKQYEVLCRDAHYVTIASRVILTERVSGKIYSEEEIFRAEQAIHKELEGVDEYLDTRIRQADQKLSSAGVDTNSLNRMTRGYEAKCSTRTATDYLHLVTKADIYLNMVQYLWIMGELSDSRDEALRVRLNTEREIRNQLVRVTRTSTKHFNNLRQICNAVMQKRNEERLKKSERDRRRHQESLAKAQKDQNALVDQPADVSDPDVASEVAVQEAAA